MEQKVGSNQFEQSTRPDACEYCSSKGTNLVEHHWPSSITQKKARKLGQVKWLCIRCNQLLGGLFPHIEEVPWEVQVAALGRLRVLEELRSKCSTEEEVVKDLLDEVKDTTSQESGTLLVKALTERPELASSLIRYLDYQTSHLGVEREDRIALETVARVNWSELANKLLVMNQMKPEGFWAGKVPDEFLPYVKILEYELLEKSGYSSRRGYDRINKRVVEASILGALDEDLVSEEHAKSIIRILDNYHYLSSRDAIKLAFIPDEVLIKAVQLGCEALRGNGEKLTRQFTQQGYGGRKPTVERYHTLLSWIKEGYNLLGDLTEKYSSKYAFSYPSSKVVQDLDMLIKLEYLDRKSNLAWDFSSDLRYKEFNSFLTEILGGYWRSSVISRTAAERILEELDKLYREGTSYCLVNTLVGRIPSMDEVYFRLVYTKWTFWIEHPYGIETWKEYKPRLLTPTLHHKDSLDSEYDELEEFEDEL